ncbi:hypothetical protein [Mesorhizobium sp. Root172]|uniref:hypothetical protein n=1 Tax=Mesorhizobium sp. Root172 TaxID=1736481 RepID=UPI000AC89DF9|nr:hypothetical protein [Mesorhizobium sp. Root172]
MITVEKSVLSERSNSPLVRNPLLSLNAAKQLQGLPPDARQALAAMLRDMRDDARRRAQECWRKHKAPMAVYWKCVGVYCNHLYRVVRP